MTIEDLDAIEVTPAPLADIRLLENGVAHVTAFIREQERRRSEALAKRKEERRQRALEEPVCRSMCREAETRSEKREMRWMAARMDFRSEFPPVAGCPNDCPPNLHAPVLSFSARLLTYIKERFDGNAPIVYKRAGVSRQIYSRIVARDKSRVDKRTAIRFCFGLGVGIQEAELLLKAAGFAFSGTLPEDCAFTYCLENGIHNLQDVDTILLRCGLKALGEEKTE